ncbi:MAG: hypothetical protein CMI55_02205 [Parcubacteria group bacterium]|nr:hypothetical protein [Parcubacteria group bacterium]|tara:strand:+ start:1689 stop:3530 length:1842 start_codon:yes stop_codon:yes gene_type:complete
MKNIYLEPDEEIVSVIDRLIQAEDEEINLIVPSGAQIWQSSINLKLLKREADSSKKQITLIISNDLGAKMAERIGFVVKKEKDLPVELVDQQEEGLEQAEDQQEEPELRPGPKAEAEADSQAEASPEGDRQDMIDLLVEDLESEKEANKSFPFEGKNSALNKKDKVSLARAAPEDMKKRMVDIVNPKDEIKVNFFRQKLLKKGPLIKIRKKPKEQVAVPVDLTSSSGSKWSKFLIIFIVLALITAGSVTYLALPSAEITIFPKTELISFDLSVIGSKAVSQVDEILNTIPLQEIEVKKTKSREFVSSGKKELNEKARGLITIYNEYSSVPQTLVATTRFESSNGKVFRIMKSVTVPGAEIQEGKIISHSIEVEVVADQAGADYNIGPSNFTIPGFKGTAKFAGFYAQSKTAMTGGSVETVKMVLAEDLKQAEESLAEELKKEVKQALEEQIPTDLKIIENGFKEEVDVLSTVEEETRTDKFRLEVEVAIQALIFKEEELQGLVDSNLASMISQNKTSLSETQQIIWGQSIIDWSKKEAFFDLNVQEEVAQQIEVEALKDDLIGKSETEIRSYFNNLAESGEIENGTKITLWPFWVKKIPNQKEKIKIIIDAGL